MVISLMMVVDSIAAIKQPKIKDDAVILHAWSWSFPTIAENMKDIADAGYSYVQTSPANTCFVGEQGGLALFGEEGMSEKGKWYYHYQPIDWKIGNYQLGTREQFKAMCDSALKYNIKIIVDVVANHTAFDRSAVTPDFNNAVGGHENLYHANGDKEIEDYNDRLQCTTWAMGGLPDVNTENPDYQYYFLQYLNDAINLGARGFRYDTAKHIGLPSDPLDPKSHHNNFWDVVSGRESVKGLSLLMPDSLFVYGEVLQDRNVPEKGYADYMSMCASGYGHNIREMLDKEDANSVDIKGWTHSLSPNQLVTWVESHDTYCNAHESAHLTDNQIRVGWVFITARASGMPLFYNRPDGSAPGNIWGNNLIGKKGNDNYLHPEVVAANRFRTEMKGLGEQIFISSDGKVIEVARGNKGVALVNISKNGSKVNLETTLPEGIYYDKVYNNKFNVKNGKISGHLAPLTTYVIVDDRL